MKTVRIVLYRKDLVGKTVDVSHQDVPEDAAGKTAFDLLGGSADGADTYEKSGVRIAALSNGPVLVEVAESTSYDPYDYVGRTITGFLYRRAPDAS